MVKNNPTTTTRIIDPWYFMGPKRRRLLDRSWPGLFAKLVLPKLPVEELAETFNRGFGRPCKDLRVALGVLILQQMLDLSDEATVEQLAFNEQWHYAFGITGTDDESLYMSSRTLWNLRQRVDHQGLAEKMFQDITGELARAFKVRTNRQRLDSVHVRSNMRRLGRVGLFSRMLACFLNRLSRDFSDQYQQVPAAVRERHERNRSGLGVFSQVKPTEAEGRLQELAQSLQDLLVQFGGDAAVSGRREYALMQRLLQEQCQVSDGDGGAAVAMRPPREVPPDSLQNPSDPDAAYSGHKGQGYTAQIMETYGNEAGTPELIVHVSSAPADGGDAHAVLPALDDVAPRGLCPETLLADTAYGGDANVEEAKRRGVAVVSPVSGTAEASPLTLADAHYDEAGVLARCPMGHAPVKVEVRQNVVTALLSATTCHACPHQPDCPARPGPRCFRIRYTQAARRASQRRAHEKSKDFRDTYRWRSGVEGTMSCLDRRTGLKQLRFRGLRKVRFCVFLKALGLNIRRAAAAMAPRGKRTTPETDPGKKPTGFNTSPVPVSTVSSPWSPLRHIRSLLGFLRHGMRKPLIANMALSLQMAPIPSSAEK